MLRLVALHRYGLRTAASRSTLRCSGWRLYSNIVEPPRLRLRPYQEDAIKSVLDALATGDRRLGISLATGSGKTVIFSHLIDRIPGPTPEATRTLVLAHRRELVEQAARHCQSLYPDRCVEIEMGACHATGHADITVASVQSINSGKRLSKYDPKLFKLVLVDEAHHIVAQGYMDVLRHFGLADPSHADCKRDISLVGVSATFSRPDGLSLGAAIDRIVYHKDYVDMIADEWLSNVTFTTVHSSADLSKVKSDKGDFRVGGLSRAVNTPETNTITVRSWLSRAQNRKSTLVFCVDLSHVASLTAVFRQHGVEAQFVTGETPSKVRAQRLAGFKAGRYPVLLNCGIFTEGTDIPNIDCVLLARPTKSRNLLVQMIGRGLRKTQEKTTCLVLDMVGSLADGIVTTPSLFGLDPDEVVTGADSKQLLELKVKRDLEREAATPVAQSTNLTTLPGNITFTEYEDVNDLIQDTAGERSIRAISRLAWVQCRPSHFVLSNSGGDYITLKQGPSGADSDWVVSYNQKLPADATSKAPYMRPRDIAKAITFEAGVRAADTFAKTKFPYAITSKTASWRSTPASSGQVEFLNKSRKENQQLDAGSISKGKAADWITKIKHGVKGAVKQVMADKRKMARTAQITLKAADLKRRAEIRVGPLRPSEN